MAAIGQRLRNELERFVVPVLEDTGKLLGKGAYAQVVEMKLNGETVAVKKIHDTFLEASRVEVEATVRNFEEECVRYIIYVKRNSEDSLGTVIHVCMMLADNAIGIYIYIMHACMSYKLSHNVVVYMQC